MRSTNERLAAVERRVKERKRQGRDRLIALSATAAGLLVIVGVGLAMPGILGRLPAGAEQGPDMAGSIFQSGAALGFVLVGLLAFALGVGLTVLCYHLRERGKEERREDDHD